MIQQVILGDCLIEMEKIPDKSIDFILCDPPFGTTALRWDEIINFKELWFQYKRIIKENGAICLFSAQPFTSLLIYSNLEMFKYEWIWVKNTQRGIALANYQPMRKHENICVFYSSQPVYNKQPTETESEICKSHAKRGYVHVGSKESEHHQNMAGHSSGNWKININPNTVLKFNVVANRDKNHFHPTQKPVKLCEYLIKTYTNEDDLILDNCAGSGSTLVAAKNLNRQFIGIEKEPSYYDIILKRLA